MFYLYLAIVLLGITIISLIGYDVRDMFHEPEEVPADSYARVSVPDFVPEDIMELPYVARVNLQWQQNHGFKAIYNWEDDVESL